MRNMGENDAETLRKAIHNLLILIFCVADTILPRGAHDG